MTLLSDVNSLGFQEDLVSNWEPAHSLVEDFISGAEIAPYLSALAVACLPLCLRCGNGLVCSQVAPLWYSLNPLFCEQTQLCLRLKLFAGSLSFFFSFLFFFFLSLWLSYRMGCSLTLAPSGHSVLVLTLSMQLLPPCSAPALWR